jgi:dTDP-4-amino-4,6-dideoxygalactose transaminase
MAFLSLDLAPGDEVITTPMTFAATLNTIVLAGGKPVLVDIEPDTYNIDVAKIEAAITKRTKAIAPVHFAGRPVDLDPLYALANKYGLRVIEDAAQAIGTTYKGRRVGSFGDIQVFSFHPNKNITTGEGCAIVVRDEAIKKRIELLRFHGIDRDVSLRHGKSGSQTYDIALAGYKFNMTDIQAAMGIHQLPRVEEFNACRCKLANRYYKLLENTPGVILPRRANDDEGHSWHLFNVLIDNSVHGINRDQFIERMKERNIGTGLHYSAPHLSSFYRKLLGDIHLPIAEGVCERIVSLPLFPLLTDRDQNDVVETMKEVLGV